MGPAQTYENYIDALLNAFVAQYAAAFSTALVPVALLGLTIYITLMGWAVMRGEAADPLNTIVWKLFRASIISALALSAGVFNQFVWNGIMGLQGAFVATFAGVPTIGQMLDNALAPYSAIANTLMSGALTGMWPKVGMLIGALIVYAAQFFVYLFGLGIYLMSKVALDLLLCFGPAFILCAIWPSTQRFTEAWLAQCLQFVLSTALVAACITMLTSFLTQYANAINANIGTTQIMMDTLALLMVSVLTCIVFWNVRTMASALSGGAMLRGWSPSWAAALRMPTRGGRAGNSITGGSNTRDRVLTGSRRDGGGGSGPFAGSGAGANAGSVPQFQRNVIENIQQASAS